MCFAWLSEQRAIISLYSIKLSGFKTEAESVYCAVRNGVFKSGRYSFAFKGLKDEVNSVRIKLKMNEK